MNPVDRIAQTLRTQADKGRGNIRGLEWVEAMFPTKIAVSRVRRRGLRQSLIDALRRVLGTEKAEAAQRVLRSRATFAQYEQLDANADEVAALFIAAKNTRDIDVLADDILKPNGAYAGLSRSGRVQVLAQAAVQGLPIRYAAPAIRDSGVVESMPPMVDGGSRAGDSARGSTAPSDSDDDDGDVPPDGWSNMEQVEELAPLIGAPVARQLVDIAQEHPEGMAGVARDTISRVESDAARADRAKVVDGLLAQYDESSRATLEEISRLRAPRLKLTANGSFVPKYTPRDYIPEADRATVLGYVVLRRAYPELVADPSRDLGRIPATDADKAAANRLLEGAAGAAYIADRLAALQNQFDEVMLEHTEKPTEWTGERWVDEKTALDDSFTRAANRIRSRTSVGPDTPRSTFNQSRGGLPAEVGGRRSLDELTKLRKKLEGLQAARAKKEIMPHAKESKKAELDRKIADTTAEIYRLTSLDTSASASTEADVRREAASESDDEQSGEGLTPDEDKVRMLVSQRKAGNTSKKLAAAAVAPLRRLERAGRIAPGHGAVVLRWLRR